MAELNPVTVVAASGVAQTLTSDFNSAIDPVYDITLTGNCALALSATAPSIARIQTITIRLKQDSTAGRVVTLPVVAWPNGSVPSLNTRAGYYDVLQFSTVDAGAAWFGSVLALGVQVPAKPAAPSLTVAAGNAQSTLTIVNGAANGSPITSYNLYRGTSAGGEALVGQITTTNGTYVDTGETNGTAYYFQITAINGVGESARSSEVSATPAAPAAGTPTHYMAVSGTNQNAYSTASASNNGTDNFVDVDAFLFLNTYAAPANKFMPLVHTWSAGTSTVSNSSWDFGLSPSGALQMLYRNSDGYNNPISTATLPSTITSNAVGGYLRCALNLGTAAVTTTITISGSAFSAPAGSASFFTSTDGTTWTQLGTTVTGLSTAGLSRNGTPTVGHNGSTDAAPSGKFYKAIVRNSTAILWNPDFTAQATGATSVVDTAQTPNTFTLYGTSVS